MKTLLSLFALGFASFAFAATNATDNAAAPAKDSYPLTTCVVSGEKLGSMGEPYVLTHTEAGQPDREVRLCCEMCKGRFNSAPAKYLAKLDAAQAAPRQTSTNSPKSCCGGGGGGCTMSSAKAAKGN